MPFQRLFLFLLVCTFSLSIQELNAFTIKLKLHQIRLSYVPAIPFRVSLTEVSTAESWDTVFSSELADRDDLRTAYTDEVNVFTFTGLEKGVYRLYITDQDHRKYKIVDQITVQEDLDLNTIYVYRFDYGIRGCVMSYVPSRKYTYYDEQTKYKIEGNYKSSLHKGYILTVGEWHYYHGDTLTKTETYNRKGELNGPYYCNVQHIKVYGELKEERLIDQWTFVLEDGRKLYSTFLYDPKALKQKKTRWSVVQWSYQWYIECQIW